MTLLALTPPASDTAEPTAPVARLSAYEYVAALFQELRRALSAEAAYTELARRSDAQLADVGLTRTQVAREIHRRFYA